MRKYASSKIHSSPTVANFQLLLDGQPIKCGDSLPPNTYDNLELEFCLPDADAILESQGLTRENFKSLVASEVRAPTRRPRATAARFQDGSSLRSMGIFATIYVFDTDQSAKMVVQQKIESAYKKDRKSLFSNEPIPAEKYWAMPFARVSRKQSAHKCLNTMPQIIIMYTLDRVF